MTRAAAMTLKVLLFFVVVVLPALAALAATAPATTAEIHRRLLDRVRELLQAEPDAALVGIDAYHEQVELVADADEIFRTVHRTMRHLRDVQQPVDAGLQLDERAEVGEAHHLAGHPRAERVRLLDRRPRVRLQLLD